MRSTKPTIKNEPETLQVGDTTFQRIVWVYPEGRTRLELVKVPPGEKKALRYVQPELPGMEATKRESSTT